MTQATLRSALAAAALVLTAAAPRAQVVLDDFDDDDFTNAFVFSETNAGISVLDGDGALGVSVDPAAVGGFIGFGVGKADGGTVDASNATALSFPLTVTPDGSGTTTPFSFVINLQEDADGDGTFETETEDEFQAFASVTPDGARRVVTVALDGFTDTNGGGDGAFDFSRVRNVVFIVGGSDALGDPFTVRIDEIVFSGTRVAGPGSVVFNDFDDGDVSDVFPFSGNSTPGNAAIATSVTDGAAGTDNGLAVRIDPPQTNGFVGFGFGTNEGGAPLDATGAEALTFYLRAAFGASTQPFGLIVKLVEDADGDGATDPAVDDEFQTVVQVAGGTGYRLVSIPTSAFQDADPDAGANDGFDYSKALQVVYVIGGSTTLGDPFTLSIDEVAFATAGGTSAEGGADRAGTLAPTVFPNPAVGRARVAFTLDAPGAVRVDLFDVLGRRLQTALDGPVGAGTGGVDLDVRSLAPGVYVIRVASGAAVATRRFTVVR